MMTMKAILLRTILTVETLLLKLQRIEAQLALKKAQKKKNRTEKLDTNSTLQVPDSPPRLSPPKPRISLLNTSIIPAAPISPQRILLGIDQGKKASQVSLKKPWKAPTLTPEKAKTSFADRLAAVSHDTKRKVAIEDQRERKKSKTFSATALASSISKSNVSEETEEWCKYTGFNLRTRILAQSVLKEEFKGKTTYSISELYRLVTPPLYEAPEYDTLDFLVTGIVASKSPVRQSNTTEGGNYLVIKLTDLKVISPIYQISYRRWTLIYSYLDLRSQRPGKSNEAWSLYSSIREYGNGEIAKDSICACHKIKRLYLVSRKCRI